MTPQQSAPPCETAEHADLDLAGSVEGLRVLISKAEAFTTLADDHYEESYNDRQLRHRVGWILSEAAAVLRSARDAVNKLAEDVTRDGVKA